MTLKDWLAENDITVPDFARKIRVKAAKTAYRYINGERIPNSRIMTRITAATNGAVTANDFYAGQK